MLEVWRVRSSKIPILFLRVNRYHEVSQYLLHQLCTEILWIQSQRKHCYSEVRLCIFSMYACMYKHCVHACVCRGHRAQDPSKLELWTAVTVPLPPPPPPRCFCKSSKCSFTTNISQPLLYGLYYFSVIGLLQKQQIQLCKYDPHFTPFLYYNTQDKHT